MVRIFRARIPAVSKLFRYFRSDPDPNANPVLWTHRLKQLRPLSTNPFVAKPEPIPNYGLSTIESSGITRAQASDLQAQSSDKASESSQEEVTEREGTKNQDSHWGEEVSGWLNLFYDLAWTATFSSLTSNNKFREPWDSVSYVVFFATAWWLWVSQIIYNADFYTDDWLHLIWIFLQLSTFGALAATTTDFDVRNYINRSPGSTQWETFDIMSATPEQYRADRLAKISLRVIMVVLAISRLLLFSQYARVACYARRTSKSGGIPRKLLIVSASLAISAALFFGAFAITMMSWGRQPIGAGIKFALWGTALLVEVVAHLATIHMDVGQDIRLVSHRSITGRLNDITTIILGEGINAIAQTFYSVLQTSGSGKTAGIAVVCCGVIVFFLAYLYFEGAVPLEKIRHRATWMMMHLPWLLSVILLLEGAKNQLLLTHFLRTTKYFLKKFNGALNDDETRASFNNAMQPLLLQSGASLANEWGKYDAAYQKLMDANVTDGKPYEDIAVNWVLRVQLTGIWGTYNNFMNNGSIPEDTYKKIVQYLNNDTVSMQDVLAPGLKTPKFDEIVEELLKPSLTHARYIVALSGATFICLAIMNLIQSWPRDRFHWGSIISRFAMGAALLLLLVLNVGKYQHYMLTEDEDPSRWAGVFRWVDVSWVLPTIAIAYALQFIIDALLTRSAVKHGRKRQARDAAQAELPENKA